jgi:hypothetical protein
MSAVVSEHQFESREQLSDRVSQYRQKAGWTLPAAAISLLAGMVVLILVANLLDRVEQPGRGIIGVIAFAPAILLPTLFLRYGRQQAAKFGLVCSKCKQPLLRTGVNLALATGRCGGCGVKLFEDETAKR